MLRKWVKIGAGAGIGITSIIGLFIFLSLTYNFEIVDLTGNQICAGNLTNPCISEFKVINPTNYNVDVYNKNETKLDFIPEVIDYALFVKDNRCSATGSCRCELKDGTKIGYENWRCIDFTNKTKVRKDVAYNYRFSAHSTTNFMLIGFKYNPSDNIKWSFTTNQSELDPWWYSISGTPYIPITELSMELGSQINITANLTGYSGGVCVDIDHPSYGLSYSCGTPSANFLFNITYFRKKLFAGNQEKVTVPFGNNFSVNDTLIKIPIHQYDEIDGLSFNISANTGSPNTITIYKVNSTEYPDPVYDRIYQGSLLGDKIYLNTTFDNYGTKIISDDLGGVDKYIYLYIDDNIGMNYIFNFDLNGSGYGTTFFDPLTNDSSINHSTADISKTFIMANGTDLKEFVFDEFTDGTIDQRWDKTPDYSYSVGCTITVTNSETGGYLLLHTSIDDPNHACSTTQTPIVFSNMSYLNLRTSENISFSISSTYYAVEDTNYVGCSGNSKVELGGKNLWTSSFLSDNGVSSGLESSQADVLFKIYHYNKTNLRVQITGEETSSVFLQGSSCEAVTLLKNWTSGTYIQEGSGSSCDSSGNLDNDFFSDLDYTGNYSSLQFHTLATKQSHCLELDLDMKIYYVNNTLKKRYNSTIISKPIYETLGKITRATPNADIEGYDPLVGIQPSLINFYLSADNGTHWESAPVGSEHVFNYAENSLRWKIDFNFTANEGTYLNNTVWVDNINISVPTGYPSNITIDFGKDGTVDYLFNETLNESNSPIQVDLSGISLTNAFINATKPYNHLGKIPLVFNSESKGILIISNINLTYNPNPVVLNLTYLNAYTNDNMTGNITIPIGAISGEINISDLKLDYVGGNDTIDVLVYEAIPADIITITTFNNSLTSENLLFAGNQNITRWLSIPQNVTNFTEAFLNLSGFGSGSSLCYQETANVSNPVDGDCNINYSGNYLFEFFGNGALDSSSSLGSVAFYDGNYSSWMSWGWLGSGGTAVMNITINYTKNGINASLWYIKTSGLNSNYSIPQSCNDYPSVLSIRIKTAHDSPQYFGAWCKTISGWDVIVPYDTTGITIYDEAIYWNITGTQNTINVTLSIENYKIWNYSDKFNQTNNRTSNFASTLNNYLNATYLIGTNYTIPFIFHSDTEGILQYSDLSFSYENFSYVEYGNYTNNDTLNLINFYSKWDYNFPHRVNYLEFIPRNPNSKNVTPYGQTPLIPIFNITTYNHGGRNANQFIYLNQSLSCVNLYSSLNNTKASSSLWDGLVDYYPFDIDTRDIYGNRSNITKINGSFLNSSNGKQGGAYEFNVSNYLRFGSYNNDNYFNFNFTQNYTFVLWFKQQPTSSAGLFDNGLFQIIDETGKILITGISISSGQNLTIATNTSSLWQTISTNYSIPYNSWQQVAVVYSNYSITLYHNGTFAVNGTINSPNINAGFGNYLGYGDSDTNYFNGTLDEFRIYNRTLNSNEILSLYKRTSNLYFDSKLTTNWTATNWNAEYLNNSKVWFWADFGCNFTTWHLFNPDIYFRSCASDVNVCSEDLGG